MATYKQYVHAMQEPFFIQSLLETLLYAVDSQKFNLPKLCFSINCNAKHVKKSIRHTLEMTGQLMPASTLRDTLRSMRECGDHERRIYNLLRNHGKADHPLVFFRKIIFNFIVT